MNKFFISTIITLGFVFSTSAMAANLTNYDPKNQAVEITEHEQKRMISLESDNTLEGICMKGCSIKLSNGTEYDVSVEQILSIENDELYHDGDINEN